MGLIALVLLWLSFVAPLCFAAVGRHRLSTKVGALVVLAIMLILNWLLVLLALAADERSTATPLQVGAPLVALYLLVALLSSRRKLT